MDTFHTRADRFLKPARALSWMLRKMSMRIFQYWGARELSKRGYLDFLKDRPADAFSPALGDLWFLYRTVRQKKPVCILELGSGCSTVIMVQALADNAKCPPFKKGFLYSVDADARWREATLKYMPPHLRQFCEVSHSQLREEEYDGTPVFRHANIPDVALDMLFLDGPSLTTERHSAVDPLYLEDRFLPGFFMIVDGRWRNAVFLRKYLKRRYLFKNKRLSSMSVFQLVE